MTVSETERYAAEKIIPSFDKDRQALGRILPLKTPFNVLIDTSEVCNFRCQYCFRANQDRKAYGYAVKNDLMQWNTFTHIVEQILAFPEPVKQISLSGHGEPLCNKRIPDMVRYIKEKGIRSRVSLHTNASLLDKEYAERLADSDIDRVVVSLQGMTAKKYKEVCGAVIDYERFYENLAFFSKRKQHTQLHIKIADVALDEGEEEQFYERFLPIADRAFIEQIVPIWKETEFFTVQEKEMKKNKYGDVFPKQHCCPVLFHTMHVTPSGDVYPCTQLLYPKPLGNVWDSSLLELWNGAEKKKLMREQLELRSPEICKGCYIKDNSIFTKEDLIDDSREEILQRLCEGYVHLN